MAQMKAVKKQAWYPKQLGDSRLVHTATALLPVHPTGVEPRS